MPLGQINFNEYKDVPQNTEIAGAVPLAIEQHHVVQHWMIGMAGFAHHIPINPLCREITVVPKKYETYLLFFRVFLIWTFHITLVWFIRLLLQGFGFPQNFSKTGNRAHQPDMEGPDREHGKKKICLLLFGNDSNPLSNVNLLVKKICTHFLHIRTPCKPLFPVRIIRGGFKQGPLQSTGPQVAEEATIQGLKCRFKLKEMNKARMSAKLGLPPIVGSTGRQTSLPTGREWDGWAHRHGTRYPSVDGSTPNSRDFNRSRRLSPYLTNQVVVFMAELKRGVVSDPLCNG
ncbi:hypothetical protein DFH07DRAFT_774509 [Mycena maculata]|uniref:Uncharacterized protein n=1 Tax=Mycena maculata TaxID=230809 RepID=A0AAD7IX13_9AGAR|nr:hypothetical protein DFH07DRAFT_774509 [Mycena maculata]